MLRCRRVGQLDGKVERRLASQQLYDLVQRRASFATEAQREATGWISIRRPKADVLTAELDEDSFFLAFDEWGSFVEHGLGQYASAHADVVASVYTYRLAHSANHSNGEGHSERGWHSACFIGVVGRDSGRILDTIALALTSQVGVPKAVVEARLKDQTKLRQISCRNPSEYMRFDVEPSWHVEDGRCWAPQGEDVWCA